MGQVLVLNASYEPLNVCTVRRAHVLVFKGKAEVIEELERPLHSATDTYPWPHVIRLVHYVRVPRAVQAEDLAPGALRARRLALRLLRDDERPADARPRRPAQPRRRVRLGERRHRLRTVQPQEGKPDARGVWAAPAAAATSARPCALHPARGAEDPERVAAVPDELQLGDRGRGRVAP